MKIRLCYSSLRVETEQDLLQDLSDILVTARSFNAEQQICGVLYYAQGAFFQCLEGEKNAVEALFEKIKMDPRHKQVHQFQNIEIEKISFKQWSMKYVKFETKIGHFFKDLGFEKFEPMHLNTQNIQDFVDILLKTASAEPPPKATTGYQNRGYQNFF